MKYSRFEDLPVWQAAMRFALGIFELVKDRTFNGEGDLRDQLQRSSLSISFNVAEGVERGTTNELLYFLYVARGSAGEARSGLRFCDQYPPMAHLRTRVRELIAQGEGISRQRVCEEVGEDQAGGGRGGGAGGCGERWTGSQITNLRSEI